GACVEDKGGEEIASCFAATGEVIATVHGATPAIIEAAVSSARQAQGPWAARPGAERGRILLRAAQILRERNDEIARIETLDTGKALSETLCVDVVSAADNLEYFGHIAATMSGEMIRLDSGFAYTQREALGVCAGLGAWNYPIQVAAWKLAPALACGNGFVFKPSELTPLSALVLAEILSEAGLPDGVFNVIQGGGDVGAALGRHPDIAKISLTGSVPTGKKVMAGAADSLKSVTLELGGKSPLIVFDDADIENAVSGALLGNFYSTGQVCSNGTRVFVQNGVREAFITRLKARTRAIKLGNPLDPETQMGPMISRHQRAIALDYIAQGKAQGADLLCGGKPVTLQGLEGGAFIEPAIFDHVRDDMSIAREEIFGPVLSLLTFETQDEVIERANASAFGLAAGVFTADLSRAHQVIGQIKAGTCWINTYNITPVGVPFGGMKGSGMGRENARAAVESYSQIKSVCVETGDVDAPY
ncbi:MAG TPA: betaine-aldehyde dehydrogenase, partial [Rhizobiales bacterium]|nr:betaine-aldehyde dehydrogenase [Hyphomicrobiales bacterium]